MPEPRRIDKDTSQLKGYALMGYSLFLALRSQDSDTPLFSARVINLRVTRIESPYQNTITFSIPKKQDKTSTTGAFVGIVHFILLSFSSLLFSPPLCPPLPSPSSHAVPISTAPLPFIIPGSVLRPDEPDQLKLVTDILLYDQEDRIMWSRSGWLFPKRYYALRCFPLFLLVIIHSLPFDSLYLSCPPFALPSLAPYRSSSPKLRANMNNLIGTQPFPINGRHVY